MIFSQDTAGTLEEIDIEPPFIITDMDRIAEAELMDSEEQARAYASADFNQPIA